MNSSNKDKAVFRYLLTKAIEGQITPSEIEKLNILWDTYPDLEEYYFDNVLLQYLLSESKIPVSSNQNTDLVLSTELWQQMLEHEETAPEIEIPKEKPQQELIRKAVPVPQKKFKMSKFNKFTLAACAAMILFFVYLRFAPQKTYSVEVATLVDQMNVKWADSAVALKNGERLWTNQGPLSFKNGVLEILYDDGVSVVIEGPASFEIDQSRILLDYGRLYSRVSEAGLGFTIKTPTSQFVDMGTEFGVQAYVNGSSELHVIKGKVQLFAGAGRPGKFGKMAVQGHAVRYDAYKDQVDDIPIKNNSFIRAIDSKKRMVWRGQREIDLADIVGAGDGFGSGYIESGIDTLNGIWLREFKNRAEGYGGGDTGYRTMDSTAFIDGVFVPDGEYAPVQVSSLGDQFSECPDTAGGYWIGIQNGAMFQHAGEVKKHHLTLSGKSYLAEGESSIGMHANQGITFDLNAIRSSLPELQISQFTALCGLSDSIFDSTNFEAGWTGFTPDRKDLPVSDFWVLIDGQIKYSLRAQRPIDDPGVIKIQISERDRFLTLITTDSDLGGIGQKMCLFANPKLHLENREE